MQEHCKPVEIHLHPPSGSLGICPKLQPKRNGVRANDRRPKPKENGVRTNIQSSKHLCETKQNLYIACLNILLKQVRDKSLAKIKSPLDKIIESKRQDNKRYVVHVRYIRTLYARLKEETTVQT